MALVNYRNRYQDYMKRSGVRTPPAREQFFDTPDAKKSANEMFFDPLPKPFKEDGSINPLFGLLAISVMILGGIVLFRFILPPKQSTF